ncbi:hypothetical protein INT43_002257 [Umbelopsis isabellina]|uniref:Mitochondrial carrier protein n=1 Tax=Mortierella isabellina TaxID=91625 RepID=A0A8H7Q5R9_MORIS|nr:hypothetical protein INT43_002257 [Umbelopsis isabellina]
MSDTIETITELEELEENVGDRIAFGEYNASQIVAQREHNRRLAVQRHGELQKRTTSSSERMLSACTGALLTSLLVTPLDVVKTRLQSQEKCATGSIHFHRIADAGNKQLNGTLDGLYKIVRYEGVTSLWRGLSPALAMSIPATIIYFVGYDAVRDKTRQHIGEQSTLYQYSPLWAGGVARTFAAFLISPIELFRTRMQSVDGVNGFKSVLSGVQTMVKQHGPRSLWRGLVPTMWRDVPFSAFYWMSYEKSRSVLLSQMAIDNSSGPVDAMTEFKMAFAAGAISGMIAAVLTTPFDVVKTRLQVGSREERRMLNSLKDILRAEGIRGLYRGCIPRLAKIAPSCAIMISSYELGKMFFARRRAQEHGSKPSLSTQ